MRPPGTGAGASEDAAYTVRPVGWVRSSLTERADAPKQADEGAPQARVVLRPEFREAARDLRAGDEIVLLTWLHLARRDVSVVHPRGDRSRPRAGVFSTRSPDRPNPIGLHRVAVQAVEDDAIIVESLEAVDGTPVLDVKPVLGRPDRR